MLRVPGETDRNTSRTRADTDTAAGRVIFYAKLPALEYLSSTQLSNFICKFQQYNDNDNKILCLTSVQRMFGFGELGTT